MSAPTFDLLLKGDVVLSDRIVSEGYIAISGDKIAAVGAGDAPPASKV